MKTTNHAPILIAPVPSEDTLASAIVHSALDAIITIDSLGIVVTVNPAAERMFGYQARELMGLNVNILISSPWKEEHDDKLRKFRIDGDRQILGAGQESIALRRDGTTLTVEFSVSETYLCGRSLLIGTLRDITSRKLLEQRLYEQTDAVRAAHTETINHLLKASIYRDAETGAHMQRSGANSALLATAAGWAPEQVELLRLAAPMHDLGKIGIPDAILCKPGQLTAAEILVMQTHTLLGAKMLAGSSSPVLRMAHDVALYHHERWDGHGYSVGLAAKAIPTAARIVSIVDVFDALTHDRVYRRAFSEPHAIQIMNNARGRQFDPQLLDLFLSILPQTRLMAALSSSENGKCLSLRQPVVIAIEAPQAARACVVISPFAHT